MDTQLAYQAKYPHISGKSCRFQHVLQQVSRLASGSSCPLGSDTALLMKEARGTRADPEVGRLCGYG